MLTGEEARVGAQVRGNDVIERRTRGMLLAWGAECWMHRGKEAGASAARPGSTGSLLLLERKAGGDGERALGGRSTS